MEGGGEVILLPALGLALRLELPQALSLESLRGKGRGEDGEGGGQPIRLGLHPVQMQQR